MICVDRVHAREPYGCLATVSRMGAGAYNDSFHAVLYAAFKHFSGRRENVGNLRNPLQMTRCAA